MAGVLAAGGLMGGLALVLAELGRQQVSLQKRDETGVEIVNLTRRVNKLLYDNAACLETLKAGSSIGPTIANGGAAININNIKNENGIDVISQGSVYGNGLVKVHAMRLRDLSVAGTVAEVNFQITFEKISRAIKGEKRVLKNFPLSVELGPAPGSEAIACNVDLDSAMASAKRQMCIGLGGTYDTVAQSCTPRARTTQCTSGAVSSFDASGNVICRSRGQHPEGYNCYLLTAYSTVYGGTESFREAAPNALTAVERLERWLPSPGWFTLITPPPPTCPSGYVREYFYNPTLREGEATPTNFGPSIGTIGTTITLHSYAERNAYTRHYCCKENLPP